MVLSVARRRAAPMNIELTAPRFHEPDAARQPRFEGRRQPNGPVCVHRESELEWPSVR